MTIKHCLGNRRPMPSTSRHLDPHARTKRNDMTTAAVPIRPPAPLFFFFCFLENNSEPATVG